MEVKFSDELLERLANDETFWGRYPQAVVKGYRKTMVWILDAVDERDFYALKGLHFEHLHGRPGQHSMRLNIQFRLIVEFSNDPKTALIVAIEDYH